jgi:VWFA-related protein
MREIGVYKRMRVGLQVRRVMAAVALIALPAAVVAQAGSAAATISVDSRLVNIPVVVRDGKGALVQTLTKADFSLMVDGKAAAIRYFDLDRDLPLTLGLLVDTSGSVSNELDAERTASTAFLDSMLTGKEDKAFVIQFSRTVELLQDTTASRPKLQKALEELDSAAPDKGGANGGDGGTAGNDPQNSGGQTSGGQNGGGQNGGGQGRGGQNGGGPSGRRAQFGGGGTALYDAVFLAADELMSKQKGRKALVVLTDGEDRGSKERLADAIEAAQRSDTMIYAVYFKGEQPRQGGGDRGGGGGRGGGRGGIGFPGGGGGGGGYPGGGGGGQRGGGRGGQQPEQRVDGKKVLERMTEETGGRMFELSKKQTFAQIFDEIGKELRSQYRLGYTPDADAAEAGYHKINLAFISKDKSKFTIQTRDGYYTGK